jgi:hypothetical protein
MPTPSENYSGSYYDNIYLNELTTWAEVCKKIVAKNPEAELPPMPTREQFNGGSHGHYLYEKTLAAWKSVWE